MEKNSFLIFNDIVYNLYSCLTVNDLPEQFLTRLKLLIPFSYASILLTDSSPDSRSFYQSNPLCLPQSFTEAEREYISHYHEDPLLWLMHGKESTLVRESELLPEEGRLNSPLYLHCYQKYNIFDTLQYSITYQQQFLGIITLFRTRIDGAFSDDDMFFLRSLGMHLNSVIHELCSASSHMDDQNHEEKLRQLSRQNKLTSREEEILGLLFQFKSNREIAAALSIQENTLQKHMQNIFRKMNASSKWELLRFLKE